MTTTTLDADSNHSNPGGSNPSDSGDPNRLGHGEIPASERGPASVRIVVAYGFWIFLLSDFVLFASFFAAYAVLVKQTNGGPSGREVFQIPMVGIETALLLFSSFTAGLASVAMKARNTLVFQVAMLATAVLGLGFLALEVHEFTDLIGHGNGPGRSAFLSAFFALVGCHGVHVTLGLVWLSTMMAQVFTKGFRPEIERRVQCFNLFWHALDIIWVALFTVVYLLGSGVGQ